MLESIKIKMSPTLPASPGGFALKSIKHVSLRWLHGLEHVNTESGCDRVAQCHPLNLHPFSLRPPYGLTLSHYSTSISPNYVHVWVEEHLQIPREGKPCVSLFSSQINLSQEGGLVGGRKKQSHRFRKKFRGREVSS